MKRLSTDLRIRLLEHDPTPSLDTMRDFFRLVRAIHHASARDLSAGCVSGPLLKIR